MKEKLIQLKKFILPLLVILSEIFLYFQIVIENPQITIKYRLVFLVLCFLANICAIIICKFISKNKKIKTENIFLLITLLYGGLYLLFIPALLGTDELAHFLRPYQISVGDVIVKNPEKNETQIPSSLNDLVSESTMGNRYTKKYVIDSTDYEKRVQLWNGNVTSINYSPIPYLPQIIGFWGARLLKLSPIFTLLLVRFINFITYVFFAYQAIKILPTKKLFALVLYTSPAILSLVSTSSGDAFALGLFLLLISYILNFVKTKRKITKRDYIIFGLIACGISTYKMFYVLYLLLLYLIPKESFGGNNKKKIINLSIIVIISFLLDFGWFVATSIGTKVENKMVSEQIRFILTNPIKYLFVYINTYINDIYYYITNIVGGSEMCYGIVRLNQLFVLSYLFVLVLSYFDGSKKYNITISGKILIVLVSLAIFGLVSTTLYIDWTSHKLGIGTSKIIGIQSRYFWPLLIPIISILPEVKKRFKKESNMIKYSVLLNTILIVNAIGSLLVACFPK